MRLILGLDPSLTTVGYALLTETKKLKKVGQYKVKKDIPVSRKIISITDKIISLVKEYKATDLVIEDIFYSKNVKNLKNWARLSGAIMYAWTKLTGNDATLLMASQARPAVGIKGNAQKIEVQVKISKDYGLITDEIFYRYCGIMGNILQQYQNNKITRNRYKYLMTKVSAQFEKETGGVSEHVADSIVLAEAYLNLNRQGK